MQVAIIAEEEKDAAARARIEQQQQLDQQTISQHQNRCGFSHWVSWHWLFELAAFLSKCTIQTVDHMLS
jgi:hypothetical protein